MIERNYTDDVFHANNPVARPKLPRHAAELGLDWFAMINVGDVVVVVNVRAGHYLLRPYAEFLAAHCR